MESYCFSVGPQGGITKKGGQGGGPSKFLNPDDFISKGGPSDNYCFAAPIYINPTAGNNSGVGPQDPKTKAWVNTPNYYAVTTNDIFNPNLRPNNSTAKNPNKTNPNGKWIASLSNKYWLYNDSKPTAPAGTDPTKQNNINLYDGSYHILYNPVHRSHFRDVYANMAAGGDGMPFGQNITTNALLVNYCYGSVNPGTKDQWGNAP